jgi:lauroyl/myristoyl acyltransferase
VDPKTLPPVTGQDLMSWVYLYPVRGLFAVLPAGFLRWLLRRTAPLYGWLRPAICRQVEGGMRRALKGRGPDRSWPRLAREFMARDLRKAADDLLMRRFGAAELDRLATLEGVEHLESARGDGRGVIVISGHFHANRLAKYYLRRKGYPMMSVRRRVPVSPNLGRFGHRFVSPAYGRFLAGNVEDELYARDPGLGAGLLRRLRENGIVNIHIDAALSSEVVYLPMLHLSWPVPVGFLRLAELAGAPLVPMQCLGDSDGFEVRFGAPVRFSGRSTGEAGRQRLQPLIERLQAAIVAHPEQWEIWTRLDRYERANERN